jgi:hypothetical protein
MEWLNKETQTTITILAVAEGQVDHHGLWSILPVVCTQGTILMEKSTMIY